jgi:hypothetical protein
MLLLKNINMGAGICIVRKGDKMETENVNVLKEPQSRAMKEFRRKVDELAEVFCSTAEVAAEELNSAAYKSAETLCRIANDSAEALSKKADVAADKLRVDAKVAAEELQRCADVVALAMRGSNATDGGED